MNMHILNENNTVLFVISSIISKHLHSLLTSITTCDTQIPIKSSVKNISLTLYCHVAANIYVFHIARTCYIDIRRLSSICWFQTSTATSTHVSAFVLLWIDYCNLLLFWGFSWCDIQLATHTHLHCTSNLAYFKVIQHNLFGFLPN